MQSPETMREALEIVIAVTRAARAGRRLELVGAFAEIEQGLRSQLDALPRPPRRPTAPASAPVVDQQSVAA